MDKDIRDAQTKGLIEIARKPRSEKLAELIRITKGYFSGFWYWLDYTRANQN